MKTLLVAFAYGSGTETGTAGAQTFLFVLAILK